MSQETSAKIYRNLFTEDEWDTIFAALSDYQDYGSEEAEQSRSAQNKIRKIFELTENNWVFHSQQLMRIALLIATLAMGLKVGLAAHATVNEYQEQQADRFCQVDPNYCTAKWCKPSESK